MCGRDWDHWIDDEVLLHALIAKYTVACCIATTSFSNGDHHISGVLDGNENDKSSLTPHVSPPHLYKER